MLKTLEEMTLCLIFCFNAIVYLYLLDATFICKRLGKVFKSRKTKRNESKFNPWTEPTLFLHDLTESRALIVNSNRDKSENVSGDVYVYNIEINQDIMMIDEQMTHKC